MSKMCLMTCNRKPNKWWSKLDNNCASFLMQKKIQGQVVQGLFSGSMTPSRTKASPFLSLLGFYPQDICCIVAAQLIHYTHCFHIQDREKMEGDGGGLVAKSCPTLATPWTVACQAPPFMGMLQARILEGFAISFSRGFSRPRDQTQVSCIAGSLFTNWAMREAWRWKG